MQVYPSPMVSPAGACTRRTTSGDGFRCSSGMPCGEARTYWSGSIDCASSETCATADITAMERTPGLRAKAKHPVQLGPVYIKLSVRVSI